MTVSAVVDPDILIAAEGDVADRTVERSLISPVIENDTHGVRIGFVAIHQASATSCHRDDGQRTR